MLICKNIMIRQIYGRDDYFFNGFVLARAERIIDLQELHLSVAAIAGMAVAAAFFLHFRNTA